jgi:uncharacterized protein YabN with tetrapyrrole methylase and pyrophosphatase domain
MIDQDKASLVVIGTGIKFMSHLTTEAKAYIEQSDKVLYLVNEPAIKEWIKRNNPNAESLDDIYTRYPMRIDCYNAITDYILETLRQGLHLCVALYGHPSIFARPALVAVAQAKKEGYYAKILPGISAEDCLFADLLIDPGTCGCLSYETTDFLLHHRPFSAASHLVLWQVGIIGVLGHPRTIDNRRGAELLVEHLAQQYPLDHEVTLYEAAQYPMFEPTLDKRPLKTLADAKFSAITTLYVPPSTKIPYDPKVLSALGISLDDIKEKKKEQELEPST